MSDTRHQQNLSINSINSLIEPTTPPSFWQDMIWDNGSGGKGTGAGSGYNGLNSMGANGIHNLTSGNGVGNGIGGQSEEAFRVLVAAKWAVRWAAWLAEVPGRFWEHTRTAMDQEITNWTRSICRGSVPLDQLRPEILKLAKDQYGCRFLQKKIDENVIPSSQIRTENFKSNLLRKFTPLSTS